MDFWSSCSQINPELCFCISFCLLLFFFLKCTIVFFCCPARTTFIHTHSPAQAQVLKRAAKGRAGSS